MLGHFVVKCGLKQEPWVVRMLQTHLGTQYSC